MSAWKAWLAIAVLASAPALAQTTEEEAGDVSDVDRADRGPLRERIAPVSGTLFLKKGRFELSPSATVSIKDAFFVKYILGGTLTYFPQEWLGISLRGGYSIPVVSGAAQICTTEATGTGTTRGCRAPSLDEINGQAPGQIRLLAGLDAQWSPLYGKISLFSEAFLHFDMYLLAGPALVQYQGPLSLGGRSLTIGGNVGAGLRFFAGRWIAVRAELRDLIYSEQVQPLPNTSLRNQILFELGLSFFFPTTFKEG